MSTKINRHERKTTDGKTVTVHMHARGNGKNTELKRAIIAQANADHAQYPQYAGHWDGDEWVLMRAKRDVYTKLGWAFAKGEVTIGRKPGTLQALPLFPREVVVYSLRNKVDTILNARDFEVL